MDGKIQLLLLLGGGAWWVVKGLARKRAEEQKRQNAQLVPEAVAEDAEAFGLEAELASEAPRELVTLSEEAAPPSADLSRVRERRPNHAVERNEPPAEPSTRDDAPGTPTRRGMPPLRGRALRDAVIMSEVLRRPTARR